MDNDDFIIYCDDRNTLTNEEYEELKKKYVQTEAEKEYLHDFTRNLTISMKEEYINVYGIENLKSSGFPIKKDRIKEKIVWKRLREKFRWDPEEFHEYCRAYDRDSEVVKAMKKEYINIYGIDKLNEDGLPIEYESMKEKIVWKILRDKYGFRMDEFI